MKKQILIFSLILLILTTFASAAVDLTYNFKTINGDPVTRVDVTAYTCTDNGCNSISDEPFYFYGNSGNQDELTVIFPTELQSEYGYAIYYMAEGYLPIEYNPTWHGNGQADWTIDEFQKKNLCYSTIEEFTILNDVYENMPLVINVEASLDATTWSAFVEKDNGVGYVPPEYKDEFYSAETTVTLTILNDNDEIVHTEERKLNLFMSSSERVEFEWTPTTKGNYKAKVETEVTDNQCAASEKTFSAKIFNVYEKYPMDECYTLMNGLRISHPHPVEESSYTISVDKLSNYANDFIFNDPSYDLLPEPTNVMLTITKEQGNQAILVYDDLKIVEANSDSEVFQTVEFEWSPQETGWYVIEVQGFADVCPVGINPNEIVSMRVYVESKPNTEPVISQLPDQTVEEDEVPMFEIDLWQYTEDDSTDSELTYAVISNSNEDLISCAVRDNRYGYCDQPFENQNGEAMITVHASDGELAGTGSFKVTVTAVNDAPVASLQGPESAHVYEDVIFNALESYDVDEDELTFEWDFYGEDFTAINRKVENYGTFLLEFRKSGIYTAKVTVSDGELEANAEKTITITNDGPIVILSIPNIELFEEVTIDASTSYDPEGQDLTFEWRLNGEFVGDENALRTIFDEAADYILKLTVSDGENEVYTERTITTYNKEPVVLIDFPNVVKVNEEVMFDASASYDPEGQDLTFEWSVNGEIVGYEAVLSYTFDQVGDHIVELTVSDGPNVVYSYIQIEVIETGTLQVASIECFDRIIVDSKQSCSIFVEDLEGNAIEDADVTIRFADGSLFGSDATEMNGGVEIQYEHLEEGDFTVYATVEKINYVADLDSDLEFSYEVWTHRYDIETLEVYSDSNYLNEQYEFYRGEGFWVKFNVVDLNNNGALMEEDLIAEAALVSSPGGRAELDEIMYEDGWYYFKLEDIPLTHDFYGESQVFSFVFNFEDQSGGQKDVELTILNNAPMIENIPELVLAPGETAIVDLSQYAHDKEDEDALRYFLADPTHPRGEIDTDLFEIEFDENTGEMEISAFELKGSYELLLLAKDLDADEAERLFTITIFEQEFNPIADANGPYTEERLNPFYLDGSKSYDPDGYVTKHLWYVDGEIIAVGEQPRVTFRDTGSFVVTLMVYDNEGLYGKDSTVITITNKIIPVPEEKGFYGLMLKSIRFIDEFVDAGDDLRVQFKIKNTGNRDLENVRLAASIPELGTPRMRAGPFDVDKGDEETKTIVLEIPAWVQPGEYDVKIDASNMNSDIKRTIYRVITVK